jgi:hypothetical protein
MSTPDPAFWAVTCYYNSSNDFRRFFNYTEFAKRLAKQHVNLLVVELCASEDDEGLNPKSCTKYIRVNHPDVIWSKEALLNIGFRHLPRECTKVAWLDCDVLFEDDRWAIECSALLDVHKTAQPFTHVVFLQDGETMFDRLDDPGEPSFAKSKEHKQHLQGYRTGYGFAARRSVLDKIGGLYDAYATNGDVLAGCAFGCKTVEELVTTQHPYAYLGALGTKALECAKAWQEKVFWTVRGSLGAPSGKSVVYHMWHGEPQDYTALNLELSKAGYDPDKHTTHSPEGLLVWEKSTDDYKPVEAIMKRHFATRAK